MEVTKTDKACEINHIPNKWQTQHIYSLHLALIFSSNLSWKQTKTTTSP